jgi:ribonuclease HI
MSDAKPHFFLRCEAWEEEDRGEWKFVLTAADGSATFEACDREQGVRGERLELLAVVRALESLDQPSYITLAAGGRYVRRVLAQGLDEWRRQGWMWECFGELTPIKNRDLWVRLDRCLGFHKLETRRTYRVDAAHAGPTGDGSDLSSATVTAESDVVTAAAGTLRRSRAGRLRMLRRGRARADGLAMSSAQIGAQIMTTSWAS